MLAKAAARSTAFVLISASAYAQPMSPDTPTRPSPPAPAAAPLPPLPPAPPMALDRDAAWDGHAIWSEKDRAKFDAKMREVDEKLARLDVRLRAEEAQREVRMKAIIDRAETHARAAAAAAAKAQISPERIRAITARAMAEAQAGQRTAEAAERAIEAIQPQLDSVSKHLDAMGARDAEPAR